MNFLALVKNVCTPTETPKGTLTIAAPLAIPKPVQRIPGASLQPQGQAYQAPANYQAQANIPAPQKDAWEEPKRIRRLRDLARLGAYGDAQIDGLKVNGMFASLALKVYDGVNEESQAKFATMPMSLLFNMVNKIHMQGGV